MIGFDGVSKTYAGRRVVEPPSMSIGRGRRGAFPGGSGSGKTTALTMIDGGLDR